VLACSDGLWNYVWDAADLARLADGAGRGLAAGAVSLTAVALQGGGHDNITTVLAAYPPGALARDAQSPDNVRTAVLQRAEQPAPPAEAEPSQMPEIVRPEGNEP
jgi:serine/threonine protein phosphatase PrpC